MSPGLTYAAYSILLALFQILLASSLRTLEQGIAYNASPRDEPRPPTNVITNRIARAQTNLFETLPLFLAAVAIANISGREDATCDAAAATFLWARIAYVPLYALGIPYLRSMAWLISLGSLCIIILSLLR